MDNPNNYINQLDISDISEMVDGYLDIIEWNKSLIPQYKSNGLIEVTDAYTTFAFQSGYNSEAIYLTDFNASATYGGSKKEQLQLAHITNMYLKFGAKYIQDFEAHEKAPYLKKLEEIKKFISQVKSNAHAKEDEEPFFERINPLGGYPTDCLPFE